MNANQIIDMVVKTIVRRLVGTGVKAGMDAASGKMRQRNRRGQDQQFIDEEDSDLRPSPMQPQSATKSEDALEEERRREARRAVRQARRAARENNNG